MFEIDDLNITKEKWFELDGGRLQLKTIAPARYREIQKLTVKKKVDFKKVEGTPARLEYDDINLDLQNELFWDAVIVGWDGIAVGGKLLDCTKENKTMLMNGSSKFVKFVTESLKTLSDEEKDQTEQSEKN